MISRVAPATIEVAATVQKDERELRWARGFYY